MTIWSQVANAGPIFQSGNPGIGGTQCRVFGIENAAGIPGLGFLLVTDRSIANTARISVTLAVCSRAVESRLLRVMCTELPIIREHSRQHGPSTVTTGPCTQPVNSGSTRANR